MFVLGTAGHVDHGKSTLITRLTGIDPDRLAEEKARGLTIDLGFAWTTLPSGREIGIVDVPGHERFVHNMLAGAGQVDAVVFVVDANEGWRPQSEEHLAILDLLGARGGVVALTKVDTAPDAAAAAESVRARIAGTVLNDAEVVPVSAVTGEGIDTLVTAIEALLDRTPEPFDRGRPRLFVDRSFSIKGAGTVVTGTLTGGCLREGEEVEILPPGTRARIRSLQTHRTARTEAVPTSRVALNLAGLDRHEIRRGDAVVAPGAWRVTTTIDAELHGVRSLDHAVTGKGAFLLYAGTAETPARIRLLDAERIEAGTRAFARITTTEPVVAAPGDRIVLRDTGRRQTVAGGTVLDAHPPHGRTGDDRVAQLNARAAAATEPAVLATLTVSERGVVARADRAWLTAADPGDAVGLPSYWVSRAWFDAAAKRLRDGLRRYHAHTPLEKGIPRDTLRRDAGIGDAKLFDEMLDAMKDEIDQDAAIVRLAGHRVTLSPEQDAVRAKLIAEMDASGFSPPPLSGLASRYGAALIKALTDAGALIKINTDIAYTAERFDAAKAAIADAVNAEGPLTAGRIKEILQTSRKYAIPLLERLDAEGFTRRDGDVRIVRS
ncbi:MAG TPA: selenocysteine-specific translation elongation factor [Actinomycetota bacterium]|nr:selenocysteine-specific translation elongation factor [Actinomycetota bacterium]